MKFKTFRAIVVVVGVSAIAGASYWLVQQRRDAEAREHEVLRQLELEERAAADARAALARADEEAGLVGPYAALLAAPGLRPIDGQILRAASNVVDPKRKDALGPSLPKVNLYSDGGKRWERAKVDLDRDGAWDESWTFAEGGGVERKVSPADDSRYSQVFRLDATAGWIDASPAGAASAIPGTADAPAEAMPAPGAADGAGLRPVDRDILALIRGRGVDKVKDATKGKPYKVNLYGEGGRFTRAKVDLNRNERWDEKWTFDADGTIEREVAPRDDEAYTEGFALRDGAWVPKAR